MINYKIAMFRIGLKTGLGLAHVRRVANKYGFINDSALEPNMFGVYGRLVSNSWIDSLEWHVAHC